jgi:hypothetical protein
MAADIRARPQVRCVVLLPDAEVHWDYKVQVTLNCDLSGRVVGAIAHNGAQAAVTSSDSGSAIEELQQAVESAVTHGHGECFWHEAVGDYRWLFRREGNTMRVVILWSSGTLTGWEHRFWAECDAQDFHGAMRAAIESCGQSLEVSP